MLKRCFLLVSLLAMLGCASAPKTVYLNNEPMPGKVYSLQSTAAPVAATSVFYAMVPIKDVDEQTTFRMEYLPVNENLNFSRTEFEGLYLRLAVTNPEKRTYSVKYNVAITYYDGSVEGKIIPVGRSALDSRTFTVPIPVPPNMAKASFYAFLSDDTGKELLRIGNFKYAVKFPLVSKPIEGRDAHTK